MVMVVMVMVVMTMTMTTTFYLDFNPYRIRRLEPPHHVQETNLKKLPGLNAAVKYLSVVYDGGKYMAFYTAGRTMQDEGLPTAPDSDQCALLVGE
jgi:hypothetical protein